MRLFLDIGQSDWSTKRHVRPGSCITAVMEHSPEGSHGVMLACAEAIAGRPDPEQAAKAVTTTLDDLYYSAVDTSLPRRILEEGVNAANNAVRAGSEQGRAAAVAALILQGRRWYTSHAGHVRAWRYRDLQIKQLTRDHVLPLSPGRVEITKACGLNADIEADYNEGELKEGDIFLLTTPGIHEVLAGSALLGVLQTDGTAQQMADALVQRAIAIHTPQYAGVCIARVEKLPHNETHPNGPALPLIELPEPGTKQDGFEIKKLLIKSRRFRLYKAQDCESGATVGLRFPDPAYPESAQSLLWEESIGRRIDNPHVLKLITVRSGRRTALYSVVEYHKAESLSKRIRRKKTLRTAETFRLADQLLTTLEALHQQGVIHGDIRPHNILYEKQKRKIYLYGFTATRGNSNFKIPSSALSYRAPELFNNALATERSDIFSAGVTIYQMLTGTYPYGKINTATDLNKSNYTPISGYREGLPQGFEDIIARACALEPTERYTNVAQFSAAINAVQVNMNTAISVPGKITQSFNEQTKWALGGAALLLAALIGYLYLTWR